MSRRDDKTAAHAALIDFENGLRELSSPAASTESIRVALRELGASTVRLIEENDPDDLRRAVELAEIYGNILGALSGPDVQRVDFEAVVASPAAIYGSLVMTSSILSARTGKS